ANAQAVWKNAFNNGSNGVAAQFKSHVIKLNANGNFKSGDNVLIRFRLFADQTNNGWGWAIDNLSIQGPVTALEQEHSADFKVYPIPATNRITIELYSPNAHPVILKIMNLQGQILYNETVNSGQNS